MLTTLLPWAALALAAAGWFLRDGKKDSESEPSPSFPMFAAVLLAVLAIAAGFIWNEALRDLLPTTYGFAAGIGVVLLATFAGGLRGQPANALAAPIAFGVFGAAIWTLVPLGSREPYQIGAAAGAGLAAWLLSLGSKSNWPARTSLMLIFAVAGDLLGNRGMGGNNDHAGSILGLVAAIAVLLATGIPRRQENAAKMQGVGIAAAAAVLALGGWLLATRHLFLNDVWVLFAAGSGAALIVGWLVPDRQEDSSFGFILAVVVWLGLATLAFGLRKGFGMSICILGGMAMLTAMGRTRALLTLGPLAMLVFYRIFRELHTDASRALDIGQHYALVGIVIGIAIPLLASEWAKGRSADAKGSAAGFLWCPAMLAVPFVSGVVLAAKGYVGVLAGLGFGSVIDGLRGSMRIDTLALQSGLAMAMVGGYRWLGSKVDLARDEKISSLIWVVVVLGVLAIAIAFLSKSGGEKSAGSEA